MFFRDENGEKTTLQEMDIVVLLPSSNRSFHHIAFFREKKTKETNEEWHCLQKYYIGGGFKQVFFMHIAMTIASTHGLEATEYHGFIDNGNERREAYRFAKPPEVKTEVKMMLTSFDEV